ncbi:RNA methyltransferase, partial [Bacillus cereus]
LQTIPLDTLTRSWHHQAPKMIHKGNYAEADITDPSFPRLPTYQSFYDTEAIKLVTDIFNEDFEAYHYLKMDISTI